MSRIIDQPFGELRVRLSPGLRIVELHGADQAVLQLRPVLFDEKGDLSIRRPPEERPDDEQSGHDERTKPAERTPGEQNGGRCSDESIEKHRSEEHTSELQSRENLVCRLLLEKKKK